MSTILSFDETTSREIAALAEAEGKTVEEWMFRYVYDIDRAVRDRDGIEALETANVARREAVRMTAMQRGGLEAVQAEAAAINGGAA